MSARERAPGAAAAGAGGAVDAAGAGETAGAPVGQADATLVTTVGRDPATHRYTVNPPVWHVSTVLFPTLADVEADWRGEYRGLGYGLRGTPTTQALQQAVAALEGGERAFVVPSGLAAITVPLLALLSAGDHLLMVDSVYGPTRRFCDETLRRLGIETTYYDPLAGAAIEGLLRDNTRVVFTESPGSISFEVQDIPAIARVAHARGARVLMDNTWGTPLFFKSFAHGVDVSIQAGTKYLAGHSDLLVGLVVCNEATAGAVQLTWRNLGVTAGPDDCAATLRGMRTLAVRLERADASARRIGEWLRAQPEVREVVHPALPGSPGHELWRRDFRGAAGLFGFELLPGPRAAVAAMLDGMRLFGMGYSWGGFESLIMFYPPDRIPRTATRWRHAGPWLRLHVGLEDPDDLIADLRAGLDRYRAAGGGARAG